MISVSAVLAKKFPTSAGIVVDNGAIIKWDVPEHPAQPTTAEITQWTKEFNDAEAAKLADATAVKTYQKLVALKTMTPAEVQSWVQANVNTLADVKDAIKTLAVGVGFLARNIE